MSRAFLFWHYPLVQAAKPRLYSLAGLKFAGYEFFKANFVKMAGGPDEAVKYRQAIYIGGAAAAEVIATTALTPLEAARIRLVSDRGYAKGLVSAITRMAGEQGLGGFYAG